MHVPTITGEIRGRVPWTRPAGRDWDANRTAFSPREVETFRATWLDAAAVIDEALRLDTKLGRMIPEGCRHALTRLELAERAIHVVVTFESEPAPEQLEAIDENGHTQTHVGHPSGVVVVPTEPRGVRRVPSEYLEPIAGGYVEDEEGRRPADPITSSESFLDA